MKNILLVAGLLAGPASMEPHSTALPRRDYSRDPRLARLKAYFHRCQCPAGELSAEFLSAADDNGLDWRLLPSISVVESSGGKNYMNNNIFGWDSCKRRFPTVSDGIHHVARQLSHSPTYKHKSLDRKLRTYNCVGNYSARVRRVMRNLGPDGAELASR